ncbi:MAG TPA: putative metal-binding motif-containing protein [Polyangiaceae bacterium]|nr:putative metal-binding motif-containing protein [Polyangiaceae bacterium]
MFLGALALAGCGDHSVRSPFAPDSGEAGAAGANDGDGGLNVGDGAVDPTLGGPCSDDGECKDDFDCTVDSCDMSLSLCRHTPKDSVCDDGVYCNGPEVCDPKLGCGPGAPVSCTDGDSCTIDTCVEQDQSCQHEPRDADGDGDPVWNCPGGGDCDDTDPTVSSKAKEICGNGKDDNCNGQIDEMPCVSPLYDTCAAPLVIGQSGISSLSLAATLLDYPTTCAPTGQNFHDVVVALSVPAGAPQDVDVVAQSDATQLSLGTADTCGDIASASCAPSTVGSAGSESRMHFYGLAPGNYPLYVAADQETNVELTVKFSAASSAPSNETCGTATAIVPGVPLTASLANALPDLESACSDGSSELVYDFTLDAAKDVQIFASPLDTLGVPELSLRDAHCSSKSDELSCRVGTPASLFARALPAGQYFLAVGSTGPSDVNVELDVADPTAPPADEGCADPPALTLGETVDLTLADHADAVDVGCLAGAPDSTHSLTLSAASDVLLVAGSSNNDSVGVSLTGASCSASSLLACGLSTSTPISATDVFTSAARAHAYAVPAGIYRAVAESAAGNPMTLTAFARPARATTFVAFADDCSAPFEIPASGGHFEGNTANANPDYDAGCDVGNQAPGGAPDQMLHLKLDAKSRVVLDMIGSNYQTMLSVRSGATCPGTELPLACAAGYVPDRSYLDLDLDAGDYYVQVDGYDGDSGAWSLDVYVTPDSL